MATDVIHLMARVRASANADLAEYEPLAIAVFPLAASLFTFLLARVIHGFVQLVQENGFKGALVTILMSKIRLVPGVAGYIERQKGKPCSFEYILGLGNSFKGKLRKPNFGGDYGRDSLLPALKPMRQLHR